MTIVQKILATLDELGPAQHAELLDFATLLRQRAKVAHEPPAVEPPPLPVLCGRVPAGWKDSICDPHR